MVLPDVFVALEVVRHPLLGAPRTAKTARNLNIKYRIGSVNDQPFPIHKLVSITIFFNDLLSHLF